MSPCMMPRSRSDITTLIPTRGQVRRSLRRNVSHSIPKNALRSRLGSLRMRRRIMNDSAPWWVMSVGRAPASGT